MWLLKTPGSFLIYIFSLFPKKVLIFKSICSRLLPFNLFTYLFRLFRFSDQGEREITYFWNYCEKLKRTILPFFFPSPFIRFSFVYKTFCCTRVYPHLMSFEDLIRICYLQSVYKRICREWNRVSGLWITPLGKIG